MGNNPSSASKAGTPAPATGSQDSPRPAQRTTNRHPHPVHTQRLAAPPEQTLAQAQGINARPKSMPPLGYTSSPSSSIHSSSTSKPTDIRPRAAAADFRTEPSNPIAVPNSQPDEPTSPLSPYADSIDAATMIPQSSMQDMSYLTRPPRMPLPIEEEIHTPGSPILAAADAPDLEDIDPLDDETPGDKASARTPTAADDEDAEELRVDKNRPTVPTRLEWTHGGDKVYVTGTIFQWNRKHRLLPVEGRPGVFEATINILPGTHHVRFLVDGQMCTSIDLPTTVDFGNNLVNYIEVNPDDAAPEPQEPEVPPTKEQQAALDARTPSQVEEDDKAAKAPKTKDVVPVSEFKYQIPKYLLDFDQSEDSPGYQSAVNAIDKLPTPPSLPGFLGKPILNAAVLMKDDNSVLNMPNHTVLNHLATSSIKNNTLAVSATTRYKSKYVTTIVYKPTGADEKD